MPKASSTVFLSCADSSETVNSTILRRGASFMGGMVANRGADVAEGGLSAATPRHPHVVKLEAPSPSTFCVTTCARISGAGVMPEERSPYSIRYIGATPASLEASDLIKTLSAITRISMKASQTIYGSQARTSFRIAHVHSDSIDIHGFIEVLAGSQPTFALLPTVTFGISDVPELIKQWLDLLKFLKGESPKTIQTVTNGNAVKIENSQGEVQIVNGNIYNTFVFNNIGRDAEKLEIPVKRGAQKLELYKGKRRIGTYAAADMERFRPIKPAEGPIESEIEAILEVIAPVFEGEGVWRFRYGRMTLTAKLLDEDYRQMVHDGEESFRRGDRLRAKLKTVQEKSGGKIATKHFITKVLGRV